MLFHCFTRALRDNGPTSEPQFYLASFYPLPILSTVSPRVLINFPSVLLKCSIAFPFFPHCFTSYSLIFSGSHIGASILLGIILPSPYSFHRFSSRFCAINLSFHFINFSSVLPWCYSISPVCLTLAQMHLPQSLQLHRINGFARFFHGFFSVLLLHSGHTSKLQFFHCFSIVSRVLYAIMVPHRSLNFTWHIKTAIFPLLFHCFTRALRDNGPTSEPQFYLASFYPLPILSTVLPRVFVRSIYPSISSIFPVFCHGVTRFLQCV